MHLNQTTAFPDRMESLSPARKAWVTRRQELTPPEREFYEREKRFRTWARQAIGFAERRQRKKAEKGRQRVQVTVTVEELLAKLRAQDYCCALSGFSFWSGDGGAYGPTIPTLDRMNTDGEYSDENIRIVCLGINSLRGHGSDEQMYRMAEALLRRRDRSPP